MEYLLSQLVLLHSNGEKRKRDAEDEAYLENVQWELRTRGQVDEKYDFSLAATTIIGSGGFGRVYKVKTRKGDEVAVKLQLYDDPYRGGATLADREVAAMKALENRSNKQDQCGYYFPCVLDYFLIEEQEDGEWSNTIAELDFDVPYRGEKVAVIVQQYIPGEPLDTYMLKNSGKITPEQFGNIWLDAIQILAILQEYGIAHNDLNAGNVLVRTKSIFSYLKPIFIDFGLACEEQGDDNFKCQDPNSDVFNLTKNFDTLVVYVKGKTWPPKHKDFIKSMYSSFTVKNITAQDILDKFGRT